MESSPDTPVDRPFSSKGSLMDGPGICPISFSGLELSDEERNTIYGDTNARDLLLECPCIDEDIESEFDGPPGMSDVYYEYSAPSEALLAEQLRAVILSRLDRETES